jgi:hypothetical protein
MAIPTPEQQRASVRAYKTFLDAQQAEEDSSPTAARGDLAAAILHTLAGSGRQVKASDMLAQFAARSDVTTLELVETLEGLLKSSIIQENEGILELTAAGRTLTAAV